MVLLPKPRRIAAQHSEQKAKIPAQGYRLQIGPTGPKIEATDAAGEFYARMTLRQIARQCPDGLPACQIEDWPDFASRGVMLDISRNKVPTMATLFALVDELAEWKINELQLYTEHTFAYRNHRTVWEPASPMTAEEIRQLDAHCRARFIELVPNQNSFGHFERWLKHPRYRHLTAGEQRTCLDPSNPQSLALLEELYAELLPNFESRKFNVGCDETYGIEGRIYLEFLLKIHQLVKRHGRTMCFWSDIARKHPELLSELPRDVVALEWGYEANHEFDKHCGLFAGAGIPLYVCPGTSSWNSIAGRTDNCLANLYNAAVNGLKHGARGFLNTDWGDNGHLQYQPVSYLGFAAGAALSWNCSSFCHSEPREESPGETTEVLRFAQDDKEWLIAALDAHVFGDSAGIMGRLAYDLGNAYQLIPSQRGESVLFQLLLGRQREPVPAEQLRAAADHIEAALAPLGKARMRRTDAALIQTEFANAGRLLLAACDPGKADFPAILKEHRRLWLARNRPGGLEDSCRVLAERLREHAE